jgi:hypothetical protein
MASLAPAAPYCDILAIHTYVQDAQEPETTDSNASLDWYLRLLRDPFKPGGRIQATEMGYNNIVKPMSDGISEEIAAIYITRMLLHNFAKGVERTFIYEFFNGGPSPEDWESNWGLVRYDNSPKPAYYAVKDLLAAMSNSGAKSLSDPVPPLQPTDVSDPAGDLLFLQFRRTNGELVVAIWRNLKLWNQMLGRSRLPVDPVTIKLVLPPGARARTKSVGTNGDWSHVAAQDGAIELSLGEKVELVELTAA